MSNIFNTTALANDRLLVTGNANQKTMLYVEQWNNLKRQQKVTELQGAYDDTIMEFFAPLIEADGAMAKAMANNIDPAYAIVVSEEVPHECGAPAQIEHLREDSAIARLIEIGELDRLVWVSDDTIAITEYVPADDDIAVTAYVPASEG